MSSSVSEQVKRHWCSITLEKPSKKRTIIEISDDESETGGENHDDDDDDDGPKILDTENSSTTEYPAMYLLHSVRYDTPAQLENPYFISPDKLFSTIPGDIIFMWSFQYDLEYILPHIFPNSRNSNEQKTLVVFYQQGTILPPVSTELQCLLSKLLSLKKVIFHDITMPPYTCFHCKMLIKWNSLHAIMQIYLPSNNFTREESEYVQQMVFHSGVLKIGDSVDDDDLHRGTSKDGFQHNLTKFLLHFRDKFAQKDNMDLNKLIEILPKVDFLLLNNKYNFFYSIPRDSNTGLAMLKSIIQNSHITDNAYDLIVQTSSIGSPLSKDGTKTLLETSFSHVFPHISFEKFNYKIVFPTIQSFKKNPYGLYASGFFHFHHINSPNVGKMYNRWLTNKMMYTHTHTHGQRLLNKPQTNRQYVPSHTKFYMLLGTDHKIHTPEMWMFTTANLSKSAWGSYSIKPIRKSQLEKKKFGKMNGFEKDSFKFSPPSNYEIGVIEITTDDNSMQYRCILDYTTDERYTMFPKRDLKGEYDDNLVFNIFDCNRLVPYASDDTAFCPS